MTDPRRSQAIQAVQKAGAKICDAVLQYEVGQGSSAWNELVIARSKLMVALDALAAVPPAEPQEGERLTVQSSPLSFSSVERVMAGGEDAARRTRDPVQSSPDPIRAEAAKIVRSADEIHRSGGRVSAHFAVTAVEMLRAALGSVRELDDGGEYEHTGDPFDERVREPGPNVTEEKR